MKIGELAGQVGVRTSTIRYYEDVGLMPKPLRIQGRRDYSPEAIAELRMIRVLQNARFKIHEIRTIASASKDAKPLSVVLRALATSKTRELAEQMSELVKTQRLLKDVIDCRCTSLADCSVLEANA